MTQLPTAGPVVRRFDMSAQFTALYRISVALSQESNTERALAAILEVLHDHAFMQYGMVCLFDKERNALFVESLHGIDGERKKRPAMSVTAWGRRDRRGDEPASGAGVTAHFRRSAFSRPPEYLRLQPAADWRADSRCG